MARLNLIECDRCGAKEDAKSDAEADGKVVIRLHRVGVGEGPAVEERSDLCAGCFDKVASALRAVLLPQPKVEPYRALVEGS